MLNPSPYNYDRSNGSLLNKNLIIQQHTPMQEIGFSILGTGMVAHYHKAAIENNENQGAKLISVSHYDLSRFPAISAEFGVSCTSFEGILADNSVDVVCICTPSGQHAEQALACLRAGKHVLVEKPMSLSVKDAHKMIECARDNKRLLAVALQRRADPLFKTIKQALLNGDLGELTMASIVMPYYRDQAYYNQAEWRGTWSLDGGGVLMNQGIHIIDLLIWFMGDPVEARAFASTLHRDIEVEDAVTAALRFNNGAMATVTATTTVGGGAPHRIEIYGTNGAIQIEGEGVTRWELQDSSRSTVTPPQLNKGANAGAGADPKGISTDGHTAIVADLIHSIRTGASPSIDGAEGLRSLATIHSIYKAAGISVTD